MVEIVRIMSKQKGGRSTNMTLADKDLLIDLALKHRSIISNKKTDAVSARQKEEGCVCVAQLILDYRDTLPKSRYWAMTMSYSKLIRIVKD